MQLPVSRFIQLYLDPFGRSMYLGDSSYQASDAEGHIGSIIECKLNEGKISSFFYTVFREPTLNFMALFINYFISRTDCYLFSKFLIYWVCLYNLTNI